MNITALASGSSGNCYIIDDGTTKIIIELGIPWKEIQLRLGFNTHRIDYALISHEHGDHAGYVKNAIKSGIDCYMSRGTAEAIGAVGHRVRIVKAKEQLALGTWAILPFAVQHDAAEPLGFLLQNQAGEKLLYVTDSYYCKYRFPGLTSIMIECNYAADILQSNVEAGRVPVALKNRLLESHFSLENVKGFLSANDLSRVEEIWLLHLSDGNSDAARFKREIQSLCGKPVYIAD